jgi:hypothetical protein
MGVNNHGWEDMDGDLDASGKLVRGRAVINIDGFKIDLGTRGGPNSWVNWGGINERGEAVGWPKRLSRTRTAKIFAASAQDLRGARFFGKTAT